jgi:hypothetical protein
MYEQMGRQRHWDTVYTTKGERDVSWFEASPDVSIEMIEAAGLTRDTCVLDVGGGDSRLVDLLVARGLTCVAVLDVARAALERAQARLGEKASAVNWIEADVTGDWSWKPVDIWHDRAVFHFLTSEGDRARYKDRLSSVLKPGDHRDICAGGTGEVQRSSRRALFRRKPGVGVRRSICARGRTAPSAHDAVGRHAGFPVFAIHKNLIESRIPNPESRIRRRV